MCIVCVGGMHIHGYIRVHVHSIRSQLCVLEEERHGAAAVSTPWRQVLAFSTCPSQENQEGRKEVRHQP